MSASGIANKKTSGEEAGGRNGIDAAREK